MVAALRLQPVPSMRLRRSKRQSTEGNELKCATFRISQFVESSSLLPDRKPPPQELSRITLKLSTKRTRNLRDRSTALLSLTKLAKLGSSDYADLIAQQVERAMRTKPRNEGPALLNSIFAVSERLNDELYCYGRAEQGVGALGDLARASGSATLSYRVAAFAGFLLFEYGSNSLALYYLDRALKGFSERGPPYLRCERKLELQLYKCVGRLFLAKGRVGEAKAFGFKLLRKSWALGEAEEEMGAFQLLGKVFMEGELLAEGRYFHHRMASGERESSEIMAMSRQEMEKEFCEQMEFVCYETINIFVDRDAPFNDILENHYRTRAAEFSQLLGAAQDQSRQLFLRTHHSPNRLLANYHRLERKLIEPRHSRELHFLRPKDCHRLRRLVAELSSLLHDVAHRYDPSCYPTEFTLPLTTDHH